MTIWCRAIVTVLAAFLVSFAAILPAQEIPPGRSTAGITEPGTTRYPGNGLRYIDGYTGPPVLTRVGRTARFPGTSWILAVTEDYPARFAWFDASSSVAAPTLVTQGTLEGVGGGYLHFVVMDGSRACLYVGANDFTFTITKYTLGGPGGIPQRVGKIDLPSKMSAFEIDESAGELVAVYITGHIAKYAVGGSADLPTLVGMAALPEPFNYQYGPGNAKLLVDGPSRTCIMAETSGFRVCQLGAPGSPPTAAARIEFGEGHTWTGATWIEPGKSALFSTRDGGDGRRLSRVEVPSPGAAPIHIKSGPLPDTPVGSSDLSTDAGAGRVWQVGQSSVNGSDLIFRRIIPGSGTTPASVESEWVNPTGSGMFSYPSLRDRFHVIPGLRRAFFMNDRPDYLFGTGGSCLVACVALDTPTGAPLGFPYVTFKSASQPVQTLTNDPGTGYSYAVMPGTPRVLVKFRSDDPGAPITVAGSLDLTPYAIGFSDFAIDSSFGVGYLLGLDRIIKIDLGAGQSAPTVLSELALAASERPVSKPLLLDPEGRYGFYVSYDQAVFQWNIRKVRLDGGGAMQIVSSLPIPTGTGGAVLLGYDALHHRLIVGTEGTRVALVEAGDGDAAPTFGASTSTGTYLDYTIAFSSATFDPVGRTLEFGTNRYQPPPRPYGYGTLLPHPQVVRVEIPADGGAPVLLSNLHMGGDFYGLTSMVASPRDRRAWSATAVANKLVQFDLDDPQTTATVLLDVPGPSVIEPYLATFDDDSGIAMFASPSSRMYSQTFFRVATRPDLRGAMRGTRFHLDGHTQVTHAHLWSHADLGNARLAIYSDTNPRVLAWSSGVVPVTVDEGALSVPISGGTPSGLVLGAGDYWLCWQIDTAAGVPSHAPGGSGDSFSLAMPFGAPPLSFPASAATPTADRWTAWVSLNGASGAATWTIYE